MLSTCSIVSMSTSRGSDYAFDPHATTFRGAIEAIPKGRFEAASWLCLSLARTFGRIVLPQVLLDAAPSIGNQ